VAWSLVFECFFYLVFGFGIYFGLKIMKYVLFVWGAIIIISNLFFLPISNLFIFNNFILEFLFGCIIGYQFVFNSTKYNFKPEIMIYVGSFILLVMWLVSLNSDFGLKSAIESRLVYGLSASLIILGSAILNVQREIKIPKLLLLIGNSSYVLYLIHPIVLATAFKLSAPFLRFNESFISVFGLFVLVLSVAVGLLFHVIVEKKLIKKLNYLVFPNNKKPAYK
jgi:exopolysaccharide production protein ExoZ